MNKKIIIGAIILLGLIFPFIPTLTSIEIFLLIPFAIVFVLTFMYFVVAWLKKKDNRHQALFVFLILPIFISSQILSVLTVNKLQRIRSDRIVKELYDLKAKNGSFPESYVTAVGIEYQKSTERDSFELSYSRGFMMTEKFDSDTKEWNSNGWND
jgi:hypothetical protein